MIDDKEIEAKAGEFQLRPIDVQKDYVYGWLLAGISQRPALNQQLILKGGNALRKGYLPDSRFSKDLDFSCQREIPQNLLDAELAEVCRFVSQATGIEFVDRANSREKDLRGIGVTAVETRLYFKSFFGEQDLTLKAQVDVTQFDKIYLPIQTKSIIHQYSDADKINAKLRFQKLEEVLASKLTTLLHRRNAADLFDLLYSTVIRNIYGVSRRELITTFLRKSVFESEPQNAKQQLLDVPLESLRSLWNTVLVPAVSIFSFEQVLTNFRTFVESLFELLPSASTTTGLGRERIERPGGGGRSSTVGFRNFFPTGIRQTIIECGRSRMMISMEYDGYERLIEPYKLEYYTRKSDGRSLEYFWGWDNTGGKSRQTGIKQFICDKIQNVKRTDRGFVPRFVVEL